jgi:hypothetical protein
VYTHPRNWMKMPGKLLSTTSVSLEKRLMIRPDGVVSKKLMGRRSTLLSMPTCRFFAAVRSDSIADAPRKKMVSAWNADSPTQICAESPPSE